MSMSWIENADWETTPARPAPEGQTSNLIDPLSLGYRVTASNGVCGVFVVLIVALRFYTRMHIVRGLGGDDYALLVALVFWAFLVATMQMMLYHGLGKHVWNISLADFSPYWLLGRVLAAVFYTTAMFFVKLSLLLLYRRVFDVDRFFKRWWFVMLYSIIHTVVAIVLSFLACRPPDAQWDLHIRDRKCITPRSLLAIPVFHCINDLLILSLPIPLVWRLNLNRRRKMQVTIVFALGSASCIVSILRIWPIHKLVSLPRYGDVTWYWTPVAIWTQVELTFAIACASVPVLKPFLSRHLPQLFSSTDRTNRTAEPLQNNAPRNAPRGRPYATPSPAPHLPVARPGMARTASTKTIGQVSTRVMGLRRWAAGGLHAARGVGDVDVELGVWGEDDGEEGGLERRRGSASRDAERGGGGGGGGEGDWGFSGSTAVAGGSSSVGRRGLESSGGRSGKEVDVAEGKRARVSDDVGSEECIVKDIMVDGDEERVVSPLSDARSSTVFTAEGICDEYLGQDPEIIGGMVAQGGKVAGSAGVEAVRL